MLSRRWLWGHGGGAMDPVTLIVTALSAGALKGTAEAASTTVTASYAGLKQLVWSRLAGKPSAELILAEHEADPETFEVPVTKLLRDSGLAQDEAVIAAATRLMDQNQQLRVAHVGTRQSELLPLAPGEIHPTLETPAHHLVVPIRQAVDHTFGQALHRRGFHQEPVIKSLDLAKSNVLTNKQVITHVILEDHADFAAQILHVILAEVRSVQQDLPFGGVVEPCQELDEGRFPGAILAD